MNINEFSLEFLKYIFTYLSLDDTIKCVDVCHYWRQCVDGVRDKQLDLNGNIVDARYRGLRAKRLDFADGVLSRFTHLIIDEIQCKQLVNKRNHTEHTVNLVFVDKILMRCPNLRELQINIIDDYVQTSDELFMLIALRLPLLRTLVLCGIYGYSERIIDYLYPKCRRVVYNCSHTFHVI